MFTPETIVGRLILALVSGLITGIIVYVIGVLVALAIPSVGITIESLAYILGLVAAILAFFYGRRTI